MLPSVQLNVQHKAEQEPQVQEKTQSSIWIYAMSFFITNLLQEKERERFNVLNDWRGKTIYWAPTMTQELF